MSGPGPRRAARGVTLVEMLIALTVSALTIAAATAMLASQQRAFVNGSSDRAQQEAGRRALQELTRRLRSAGYGVDTNLIFDFGGIPNVPRPNMVEPANSVAYEISSGRGYQCPTDVRCRDSVDESASDQIVFHSRDPMFSRFATEVTTSDITVTGDLKQPMYAGQILQVSCLGGTQSRAYVTVAQDVSFTNAPSASADVKIGLQAGATSGGRAVFARENATLAEGCFNLGGILDPVVTAVERSRFYVEWYAEDGTVVAPQTAGARPYLMLDQGLAGGSPGPIPVAADVEDLQLAYMFAPAVAGGPAQVTGITPGVSIADDAFPIVTTAGSQLPPSYEDEPDAPSRTLGFPANIIGIRISVVVRSAEPDITRVTVDDRTVPAAGNRPAFLGQPNYRRSLFETTVHLPNLRTASFTYPIVNAAGGQGYNLGGG